MLMGIVGPTASKSVRIFAIVSRVQILKTATYLLRKITPCIEVFGWWRGCWVFFKDVRRNSTSEKIAPLGCPVPLVVRLGRRESDLRTLFHVFHEKCYDRKRKTPKSIIDLGANVGYSAVWFALAYPEARIIAVEPDEENFRIARDNSSSFSNVQLVRAAISDQSGVVNIVDPGSGPWAFRTQQSDQPWSEGEVVGTVDCVTFPDLLWNFSLEEVGLLKVDIEGAEVDLFANNPQWVERVDEIVIELHDRFRVGATRSFFSATKAFSGEEFRGENVFVFRENKEDNHKLVI